MAPLDEGQKRTLGSRPIFAFPTHSQTAWKSLAFVDPAIIRGAHCRKSPHLRKLQNSSTLAVASRRWRCDRTSNRNLQLRFGFDREYERCFPIQLPVHRNTRLHAVPHASDMGADPHRIGVLDCCRCFRRSRGDHWSWDRGGSSFCGNPQLAGMVGMCRQSVQSVEA